MKLDNTYYQLGESFHQAVRPTPVQSPRVFLWNTALSDQLGIASDIERDAAQYFSGNKIIEGSQPLAQAYAGHQFGGFNPQLGDGRAHLLGEIRLPNGRRLDLQLKGSGLTRFSRRGDGRCAIKPAIREYIMSESMHALGVPTTRILAVVATGEHIYRNGPEAGAIVTRIAASHLRVGTFQYFSAKGDLDSLNKLLDYAIERHYPDISLQDEAKPLTFLQAVIDKQIETVVHWMRVGFIHGVLNTDNTTISGETIDYGPCAMMGIYHPETVYSSIDDYGRYCFANQPAIMQWNMARLAECFIPLMKEDKDEAVKLLESAVVNMTEKYQHAYYQMMHNKLGLLEPNHHKLIDEFLDILQSNKLDYTQSFIDLMAALNGDKNTCDETFGAWFSTWWSVIQEQTDQMQGDSTSILNLMKKNNPLVIPRNHHVEEALERCAQLCEIQTNESLMDPNNKTNDHELQTYLTVLLSPYEPVENTPSYQSYPANGDLGYKTFCGT